jgi:hypothetical protein
VIEREAWAWEETKIAFKAELALVRRPIVLD